MATDTISVIDTVLKDPNSALKGTDLRIVLPLTRALLNELLDARPANTPIRELYIDPEAGNRFHVHLSAAAPIIGSVSRRITLAPGPAVIFPNQPWLHFEITDGLRFLDKPLINVMRGQIEGLLPKGIELTSNHLRIHVPALLTQAGYRALVPMLRELRVTSEANRLIIRVRIGAGSA